MSREAQEAAAGNEGQQEELLHILALPFQQDGHINGMLRLARALAAQQNVLVTFGYPARYHALAKKRNQLSPDLLISTSCSPLNKNSTLRVQVLEDGLPPAEDQVLTSDLVRASVPIFQNAVKLCLDDLLNRSKPSCNAPLPPLCCIISDTFMPWTQDMANAVGLPRIDFYTSPAAVYSMGSRVAGLVSNGTLPLPQSCWADPKRKWKAKAPLIDCIPGLSPFPSTDFPAEFVEPEDASNLKLQFMLTAYSRIREAHTILVHSVYELESQVFDALQANGLPIYAVGPLLHLPLPATEKSNGMNECLRWLDTQRPFSVVYAALGTVAKLTPTETHSLALGLEASGHPFLWVIRQDSISGSVSDILPQGFLQRTIQKGLGVIVTWAPQTEVLQHRAIGAFFSHCGWNSTLEAMWEGVPMVACPQAAEQRSNARWIVEKWKCGVELERQDDGSFTKEAVQRAVKEVLGVQGNERGFLKERALEIKKVAQAAVQKGGTSHSNFNVFLDRLRGLPSGSF